MKSVHPNRERIAVTMSCIAIVSVGVCLVLNSRDYDGDTSMIPDVERDSSVENLKTNRGVKLILDVASPVSRRQSAVATFVVLNGGKDEIALGIVNVYRNANIEVFDSSNKRCPYTSFGYNTMGGERDQGAYIPMRLYPGESYDWQVDLSECFELQPGKYTVRASLTYNVSTRPKTIMAKKEPLVIIE